jgi:hypothetical protein
MSTRQDGGFSPFLVKIGQAVIGPEFARQQSPPSRHLSSHRDFPKAGGVDAPRRYLCAIVEVLKHH